MLIPCFYMPRSSLKPRLQGLLGINASSVGSAGKRSTGPFSLSTSPHLPQIMSRSKARLFLFGEYCEMSKSSVLRITDTVAIVIVHKRIYIRDS